MVTGRNPWKSATETDPVYQSYLLNPDNFFYTVLPISRPLNTLLVQVLRPAWQSRMSLAQFRDAILDIPTFYSVNVHFEGNLARYCWEAGIKAREDLVDGLYGPIQKRCVPPPPSARTPVAKKPVSPIHEEAKAQPIEVPKPTPRRRRDLPPLHHHHHQPSPTRNYARRRPPPPSPHPSPVRDESMVSVPLEGRRPPSGDSHTSDSSEEDLSHSLSFPKTPDSSPQKTTFVKRRPRIATDRPTSPSYSPRLDDPMEFYGVEFCKRLAALPSDADSDETDDTMASPTLSQYEFHEVQRSRSWNSSERTSGRSLSGEIDEVIRYPEIGTPASKPIDIVGSRHLRHPTSPRREHVQQAVHRPPAPQRFDYPHSTMSPQVNGMFRHRRVAVPHPSPRPGRRVGELRPMWDGMPMTVPSPYDRKAAYASGSGWYH